MSLSFTKPWNKSQYHRKQSKGKRPKQNQMTRKPSLLQSGKSSVHLAGACSSMALSIKTGLQYLSLMGVADSASQWPTCQASGRTCLLCLMALTTGSEWRQNKEDSHTFQDHCCGPHMAGPGHHGTLKGSLTGAHLEGWLPMLLVVICEKTSGKKLPGLEV